MYDPIMRVLTVLEILQARDFVTGAELAERLEVDLRTVQRYIVRLKDLSIPTDSSRGVGGSYRLRPGFRLPPLLFTNEEALALSLGLHALRQVGLSAFAPATCAAGQRFCPSPTYAETPFARATATRGVTRPCFTVSCTCGKRITEA